MNYRYYQLLWNFWQTRKPVNQIKTQPRRTMCDWRWILKQITQPMNRYAASIIFVTSKISIFHLDQHSITHLLHLTILNGQHLQNTYTNTIPSEISKWFYRCEEYVNKQYKSMVYPLLQMCDWINLFVITYRMYAHESNLQQTKQIYIKPTIHNKCVGCK